MITWGSWDYCCGTNQPKFSLKVIAGGRYDNYLNQWSKAAAAWGHPLFLRFDPEMNGAWEEWSELVNGNRPGDFVKMWRHVHDIFVKNGATNTHLARPTPCRPPASPTWSPTRAGVRVCGRP